MNKPPPPQKIQDTVFQMKIWLHQSPAWMLLIVFCCLKSWKTICNLDPSLCLQLSLLTVPSLSKWKHKKLLGSCSKRPYFLFHWIICTSETTISQYHPDSVGKRHSQALNPSSYLCTYSFFLHPVPLCLVYLLRCWNSYRQGWCLVCHYIFRSHHIWELTSSQWIVNWVFKKINSFSSLYTIKLGSFSSSKISSSCLSCTNGFCSPFIGTIFRSYKNVLNSFY